jgi:hypothetical protein
LPPRLLDSHHGCSRWLCCSDRASLVEIAINLLISHTIDNHHHGTLVEIDRLGRGLGRDVLLGFS